MDCAGKALLVPIIGRRRCFRAAHHTRLTNARTKSGVALRLPPQTKFVVGVPRRLEILRDFLEPELKLGRFYGKGIPAASIPRFQFNDIMRCGLAHAGRANPDIAGFLTKLFQVGRAEVTHAALDAANKLGQHTIHRAAGLF